MDFSSILRAYNGDDAIAVAHGEAVIRHSPYDPLIYLPYVGLAYTHLFTGRFDEALIAASRALQANPRFSVPCYLRTVALSYSGRETKAAESARHLLELLLTFTISCLVESKITSDERFSRLAEGLRKAGLPER